MRKHLLLFLILFSGTVISQNSFNAGFLPKIVVSKKINEKVKWVNSIESRTFFYENDFLLMHSLVDVSSILSLKTNLGQSFNFGYILRFRNSEIIHRTFQHYNFVNQIASYKVGHRFAFEQFYQYKQQTTFRTRYRISVEKPLNGEKTDIKEFYIKLGNEYLYDFLDLEIRVTPYLGYRVAKRDRIEIGLDYRMGNTIHTPIENDLWLRATWYISLDEKGTNKVY